MKHVAYILLSLLLLYACNREDVDPEEEIAGKGIYLSFTNKVQTSRSQLTGEFVDYRKVKKVFLYVFERDAASGDTCVLVKNVGWKGDISQKYALGEMLPDGSYTFLAVGVDDHAGSVYHFPDAISVGMKLKDCQAALVPAFRDSLPEADLFAGFADATIQKENATLVNIELKRKVAGVQVYLKNIPYEINHSGMNYQVKSVRVSLYDDQRTSIKLWAGDPTSGENPGSRFGSGILTDSRELINIPMTDAQGVPYPKSGDGNFYAIPEQKEPFAKLANTVYGGVFLLPIAEPASTATNTLLIELWADPSSDLQDKRLKTYVVNLKKDGGTLSGCYPLEGNHLYSVGKKYSAESTVDDKPVDLLGNAIEIEVQDYEFVSCDFDFPTIDMYPPTIVPSFGQHYIFDCIHTEETIDIYAPYPYDGLTWTLTVHDTCDWIHIINDQNEYTDHFSSQGTRKVKLLINDYVKPQKESMSFEERLNDMRSATLQLETRQGDWKYVSKLEIKQYNAFMIRSKHSWGVVSTGDFGISRLDYGANFPRRNDDKMSWDEQKYNGEGEVVWENGKGKWGYFSSLNGGIYWGYIYEECWRDGELNHNAAKRLSETASTGYKGSMLEWTRLDAKEMKRVGTGSEYKNEASGMIWFMPAPYQFEDMYNEDNHLTKEQLKKLNFFVDDYYWTSMGSRLASSAYVAIPGQKCTYVKKSNFWRSRQARYYITKP